MIFDKEHADGRAADVQS